MGLTMRERNRRCPANWQFSSNEPPKKQKNGILDTLTELADHNHSYATRVPRQRARYAVVGRGVVKGIKVTLVENERTKRKKKRRSGKELTAGTFLSHCRKSG